MVDAQGGSSAVSVGSAVGDDLHRETTGRCGTVGGVVSDLRSVYMIEGLRGGRTPELGMVAPRDGRETT